MLVSIRRCLYLLLVLLALPAWATPFLPTLPQALGPEQVALVINENDPASVAVGAYYQERRDIPAGNVIRVRFRADVSALGQDEFARLRAEVERRTPAHVQAYALAWTRPYRVGCMGITSAFAFGYDPAWCAAGCGPTRASPYFNSDSITPWDDLHIRPTMLLAGRSVAEVKTLIDRGVAADHTYPAGTAYLVSTADKARNVRAVIYPAVAHLLGGVVTIAEVDAAPEPRDDVLALFTGQAKVAGLDRLGFRPGAAADHLTSTGGQLTDSKQMSALEWLSAGATASYGTVTEPCNRPQKFPNPGVFLAHYLGGATLLEAYWKSVAWPGQGVFVGEPLARPYGARWHEDAKGGWELQAYTALPQHYRVSEAPSVVGPYRPVGRLTLKPGANRIPMPEGKGVWRLSPELPPAAAGPASSTVPPE
ncbi:MAG: TIGR03790 family protein [Gallionellaceae bacterium]|nr:TIGR03790 family protein [Gallionellaceae bacterium]